MFKTILTALLSFVVASNAFPQNLLKENTWIISGAKKNVYFEQGIFRSSSSQSPQKPVALQNIRTHFNKKTKQERIVLDFTGDELFSLYGNINPTKKKISLDLMQVEKLDTLPSGVKGNYLQSVDVYIIEPKLMSLELNFDSVYSFEIFYLQNPTRVVIDVKR